MPVDNITATLNEVARVAAVVASEFEARFEIDWAYNITEPDLPLVVMRTGNKQVVQDEDWPTEAWNSMWSLSPSIEIYLVAPTDMEAAALRTAASQRLREELGASALLDFIQDGTRPEYEEVVGEVDNKPGIAGIFADIGLTVFND